MQKNQKHIDLIKMFVAIKPRTMQEMRDAAGILPGVEVTQFGNLIAGMVRTGALTIANPDEKRSKFKRYGPQAPSKATPKQKAQAKLVVPPVKVTPPPPSKPDTQPGRRVFKCEDHTNRPIHRGWHNPTASGVSSLGSTFVGPNI